MDMTPKNIGIIGATIVASVIGLFVAWKVTSKSTVVQKVDIKLAENDHTVGKKDAKAVLIEYSDFQCPACKQYHPLVKQLVEKNKDNMLFVYRYFPLPLHQNAVPSALAAEAAGRQNKFFEMHDVLFDNQTEWENSKKPEDIFIKYAKNLKIDVEKFKKDMKSDEAKQRVDADKQSGTGFGVNATPTFFLNGKKLESIQSVADFQKAIDEALAAK